MAFWTNMLGTLNSYLKIGGFSGVRLKNSSGNLLVRNSADGADAELTADILHNSGDTLELNSDAAGSGTDYKYTIGRPTTGMSANQTFNFPPTAGSANQVLQTDGAGNTSWVSAASTAACTTRDTTTLAFNSTSPVTMFTLPANAVLDRVTVIIDTAFDGTPSMTVGVSGTTSKYTGSTDVDLTAAAKTKFIIECAEPADASTEALIITYSSGSATQGSARIIVDYSVPA